jgi:hypothetical protein
MQRFARLAACVERCAMLARLFPLRAALRPACAMTSVSKKQRHEARPPRILQAIAVSAPPPAESSLANSLENENKASRPLVIKHCINIAGVDGGAANRSTRYHPRLMIPYN